MSWGPKKLKEVVKIQQVLEFKEPATQTTTAFEVEAENVAFQCMQWVSTTVTLK